MLSPIPVVSHKRPPALQRHTECGDELCTTPDRTGQDQQRVSPRRSFAGTEAALASLDALDKLVAELLHGLNRTGVAARLAGTFGAVLRVTRFPTTTERNNGQLDAPCGIVQTSVQSNPEAATSSQDGRTIPHVRR